MDLLGTLEEVRSVGIEVLQVQQGEEECWVVDRVVDNCQNDLEARSQCMETATR
jgi:hypothetical protein